MIPTEFLFQECVVPASISDSMVQQARLIANRICDVRGLGADSLVVDIASNDGYFLQAYQQAGIPVLGIEPAQNTTRFAVSERGVDTICEIFSERLAKRLALSGQQAEVIHANHSLARVVDLNGVVNGLSAMLKPNGVVVVEVPYLKDFLERIEFDAIYQEHLSYFSLTALKRLFQRNRLSIVDVERSSIHGGSLRVFAVHAGAAPVQGSVEKILRQEASWVRDGGYYCLFGQKVELLRKQLVDLVRSIQSDGKRIVICGSSAKGNAGLNRFGIGRALLAQISEGCNLGPGRLLSETNLKICDFSELIEEQPDYCLLLTPNFADEFAEQQDQFRRRGGKFIVPAPEIRVA